MASIIFPAAVVALITFLQYLAVAGHFARRAKRKAVERPRRQRQITAEMRWSALSAVIYGVPAGIVAHLWVVEGKTKIYLDPSAGPLWWLPVSVALYLLIHDGWFYWTHRLFHRFPTLFRHAHAVHHQSRPPTAWAALSFHPWEALSAAWLIPALTFVIPIHAAALLFVLGTMTFFGVTNHMGYELFPEAWLKGWFGRHVITASHHHLHHRQYGRNFGLYFRFWDRLCGTDGGLSPVPLAAQASAPPPPPRPQPTPR